MRRPAKYRPPVLSILCASLPQRLDLLASGPFRQAQAEVERAGLIPEAEVLALVDNWRMPLGEKWNRLIAASSGRFVAIVDDDDHLAQGYVRTILAAAKAHPEVDMIAFDEWIELRGEIVARVYWGLDQVPGDDWAKGECRRRIGHRMAIARRIYQRRSFPELARGADIAWMRAAGRDVRTFHHVGGEPLYTYRKRPENRDCRIQEETLHGMAEGKAEIAQAQAGL